MAELLEFQTLFEEKCLPLHSLTHAEPLSEERWSGYREGALHFGNASLTLCFGDSKLPQIELVVENIAEVDATGRYIPFPLVCRWLTMPSCTPLGAYYIYQRRGYHSVCLQLRLWKASNCETDGSQIPRFFFCSQCNINLTSPIPGV